MVFRALDESGGDVALKLLRPDRANVDVARARFLREAKLARRIESPHVAPILDVGESADVTYLVLPFYAGGSLARVLRAHGPLPIRGLADLAAQLGRGLDALHDHGILHRDVKPSNVLLDAAGTAALSDFGLARAADSTRVTREGQIVGTPDYLAPELIEGAEATRASDLYALACLLYECVAGAPPFAGGGAAATGFAHLVEPPPDPRELRPEVPAAVAEALLSGLQKDPAARPTTATALARMLHVSRTGPPP